MAPLVQALTLLAGSTALVDVNAVPGGSRDFVVPNGNRREWIAKFEGFQAVGAACCAARRVRRRARTRPISPVASKPTVAGSGIGATRCTTKLIGVPAPQPPPASSS